MADTEETEINKVGNHDDASFLLELHQSIKGHPFRQKAAGSVFLHRLGPLTAFIYRQVPS